MANTDLLTENAITVGDTIKPGIDKGPFHTNDFDAATKLSGYLEKATGIPHAVTESSDQSLGKFAVKSQDQVINGKNMAASEAMTKNSDY